MSARAGSGRPWARLLAAAGLYAAVSLVVQRELVRAGLGTHVYRQNMLGQDCLLHAWTIAWDQHALATSPGTIADANIFHPERGTLLYSDHLLGQAVLTAPLRLVTDDPLVVHNLLALAAPALDALALHALVLELTGSPVAAIVGGLVYGFVPLRFAADACQIQMSVAWWLPLMLLGALRAVRGGGRRWGIVAGLALLGQGLSGIYLTAYFLPFWALAHLLWARRHPFAHARAGWTALLAAEVAAALLLLPTALAYRGVQEHLNLSRSPYLNAILSLHWDQIGDHVPALTLGLLAALVALRPHGLPHALRAERGLFLAILVGALLLGLGPALPLPFGLGTIPGPYRLLLEAPGFTALRVPARMLHVALLGASVLAAGGVLVLRQIAWRRRAIVTLAALAALAIEAPPRALGVQPTAPVRMNPVYQWLAGQPPTAIVELPIDPYGFATIVRQYASTLHWQRSLTGVSGIQPPMHPYMLQRLETFPTPGIVAELVALGVRYAVVDTRSLPATTRTALDAAERDRRLLKRRWAHDTTVVYALRPSLEPPTQRPSGQPLDRTAWRATANVAARLAPLAVDDDATSGWRSWGDLDASVQDAWYDPVPLLARWDAFTAKTPATLTIDLGAPARVTAVRLEVGGSDPMMLPELRLGVSADADAWTTLPVRPFPDVRAIVTDAARAPVAAVLPAAIPVRYVRIEVGAFDSRVGHVAVYAESDVAHP